jgi:hypothetical protein
MSEKLSKIGKNSVVALAIVGAISVVLTIVRVVVARKSEPEVKVELDNANGDTQE